MYGGAYSCNRLQGRALRLRSTRKLPKSQQSPYPITKESSKMIPVFQWMPIKGFSKDAGYASESFLVWLPDGRFQEAYLQDGKFDGEWRYVQIPDDAVETKRINEMEPVAFMLIAAPDFWQSEAA